MTADVRGMCADGRRQRDVRCINACKQPEILRSAKGSRLGPTQAVLPVTFAFVCTRLTLISCFISQFICFCHSARLPRFYYGNRNYHLLVSDIRDGSLLVLIMVLDVETACTTPHPLTRGSEWPPVFKMWLRTHLTRFHFRRWQNYHPKHRESTNSRSLGSVARELLYRISWKSDRLVVGWLTRWPTDERSFLNYGCTALYT
jgi:hypothetical protein